MPKRIVCFLTAALSLTTLTAFAHSCEHCKKGGRAPSPWDGSNANVGYIRNTGNTNSSTLNLGTNVLYKKNWWENTFLGEFQYGKQNGKSNRQYFHFNDQVQFFLDPKVKNSNFIFVNNDTQLNRFGPYRYQMVTAAGYGRQLVNTKRFQWSAQAGPGYRRNKRNTGDKKTSGTAVLTTQTNATLMLGKWGTLTQLVRFDMAKPYNYLTTVTALTNKIWEHVAVQISFTTQYYSKIPSGSSNTEKLDTITNISLVYNY
jgi:putative salt-induced outer membrane protein